MLKNEDEDIMVKANASHLEQHEEKQSIRGPAWAQPKCNIYSRGGDLQLAAWRSVYREKEKH
jgi:hypothetical protein